MQAIALRKRLQMPDEDGTIW